MTSGILKARRVSDHHRSTGSTGVDMGLVIAHVLHSVSTTNGRIPLTIARFGPTLPLATTTKPRRRRRLISLVTARIVRPAYSFRNQTSCLDLRQPSTLLAEAQSKESLPVGGWQMLKFGKPLVHQRLPHQSLLLLVKQLDCIRESVDESLRRISQEATKVAPFRLASLSCR